MRILVSGASGLIGRHLTTALEAKGHQVFRLVRRQPANAKEVSLTPNAPSQVSGFDAVVHLAGETVMGRWTPKKKVRIRESRVVGTRDLATALANAEKPPHTLIVASAVGYYGPRGDEIITEDTPPGSDFLAQGTSLWEAAAEPARQAGIRVINFRIGMVLSPDGGALKEMLFPFKMGVGGRVGSGKQWMSWVALDDVIGAIFFALENQSLKGPVNLVAPNPVTNAEFTKALGEAVHRPTVFPVPAFVIKLAFGEMGEVLLLSGQRVVPAKLLASGYKFQQTDVASALQSMLR